MSLNKRIRTFILTFLALAVLPLQADPNPAWLQDRQVLAAGEPFRIDAERTDERQAALELAAAMGVSTEYITDASLQAAPQQVGAMPRIGEMTPLHGDAFAVLGTGDLDASPRPGTQIAGDGAARLVLRLRPPESIGGFSFRYQLLTAEYPEFAQHGYTDAFTVTVTDTAGRREVHRLAADSPDLIPVSNRNARGTGFDLFATEPGRLQGDFSRGLPVAGITRSWQTVTVDFSGSEPVEVEFAIRDQGDGLLDSVVLLDGFSMPPAGYQSEPAATTGQTARGLGSGEISDPFGIIDTFTAALSCLGQSGDVDGAVADGATKIFVGVRNLNQPGSVTFEMVDATPPQDGGLGAAGSDDRLSQITVQTEVQEDTEGDSPRYMARAQYFVPTEFGDYPDKSRKIQFVGEYQPESGAPIPVTFRALKLRRVPLVLMHGWNSNQGTWNGFAGHWPSAEGSVPVDMERGDYRFFAWGSLLANTLQPGRPIHKTCRKLREEQRISMTQVDYLGHSMGGLLARRYINIHQAAGFILPLLGFDNLPVLEHGPVNRLITLNTPHSGSPWADVLWQDLGMGEQLDDLFGSGVFGDITQELFGKAIEDLQLVGSGGGLDNMGPVAAPTHAIIGAGGSDVVASVCGVWPALSLLCNRLQALFFASGIDIDVAALLEPGVLFPVDGTEHEHDAIVGRVSQEGGLPASATTELSGSDTLHWKATVNQATAATAVNLLKTPANSGQFAPLPPPSALRMTPAPAGLAELAELLQAADQHPSGTPQGDMAITTPLPGQVFSPGDDLFVVVEPVDGFPLGGVVISLHDSDGFAVDSTFIEQAPFEVIFSIPDDALGLMTLRAGGSDGAGTSVEADPVEIMVDSGLELEAIRIDGGNTFLVSNESHPLQVFGLFSDGIERDISHASNGTVYQSSDESLVQVGPNGLLMAQDVDLEPEEMRTATVTATNDPFQDSINVTVVGVIDLDEIFSDRFE